jgi:diguanylate cyclase (GGDEF)-like protein
MSETPDRRLGLRRTMLVVETALVVVVVGLEIAFGHDRLTGLGVIAAFVAVALAEMACVRLSFTVTMRGRSTSEYMADVTAVAAAVCLLPLPLSALAVTIGAIVSWSVQSRPSVMIKNAVVTSTAALGAGLTGWLIAGDAGFGPLRVAAAGAGAMAFEVLSLLTLCVVVAIEGTAGPGALLRWGHRFWYAVSPIFIAVGLVFAALAQQPWMLLLGLGPIALVFQASRATLASSRDRLRLDGLLNASASVNATPSVPKVEASLVDSARGLLRTTEVRIDDKPPATGELSAELPASGRLRWLIAAPREIGLDTYSAEDARVLETLASIGNAALANAHLHEEAEREATHDALTGIANRRSFLAEVEREIGMAKRHGGVTALLFVDLDGFKAVNDEHGHEAGDAVLVATAKRLLGAIRDTDTAARLGGDEFTVLLRHLDTTDGAITAAQRVLDALRPPVSLGHGRRAQTTPSIGVALWSAGTDADTLMRRADRAMYAAKQAGKDRWVMAGAEPTAVPHA